MARGNRPSSASSTTRSWSSSLAEAKQELFNLRFQHVTGQLDNYAPARRTVRKDVARINTDPARARDRRARKRRGEA